MDLTTIGQLTGTVGSVVDVSVEIVMFAGGVERNRPLIVGLQRLSTVGAGTAPCSSSLSLPAVASRDEGSVLDEVPGLGSVEY